MSWDKFFHRLGVEVTILERNDRLLAYGYEPGIGQTIGEIFEKEGIKVISNASATAVRQEGKAIVVVAAVYDRRTELRAEKLLVATGQRPNSDKINIEKSGVEVGKRGEARADEFLRTNIPGIFAGGDVIGRETDSQTATPVGSHDGGIAAHNAFSNGELQLKTSRKTHARRPFDCAQSRQCAPQISRKKRSLVFTAKSCLARRLGR